MSTRWLWAAAGLAVAAACGPAPADEKTPGPGGSEHAASHQAVGAFFLEQAHATGLEFQHTNGASGRYFYPEILAPGVALFDMDNDGDLDVFVTQGHALDAAGAADGGGRLFRNDLIGGAAGVAPGTLHFTDVTAGSGLITRGYGMGAAAGDVDNDGRVDLYVTAFGGNQLFHNNGDGTFADVTKASGTANAGGFAVSAAFVDYDRDGWLDLYVGNNVNYRLDNETVCPNPAGARDYCPPQIYGGLPDRLYRNTGHGTFVDVTARALVGGKFGPALGVSTADFDGDGWLDIYVANDGEDDLLWMNQRNGTFKETGLASGIAVTADGRSEASMGVDAGDVDNDGDEDVVVAELTGQGTNLYVNDGTGRFRDASAASGLGPATLPLTGWGTAWVDYDNDGWLDVLSVNGTIIAQEAQRGSPFPYDQPMILFHGLGDGRFEPVTARAGAAFAATASGRGAAFGDVDNDGDIDVVVGDDAGPLRLLVNAVGNRQHWIGVRLAGPAAAGGRDMLGARLGVTMSDGRTVWRRARADGSYASANDPRVLVGLGGRTDVSALTVRWPDGREERWTGAGVDRWTTLVEGQAR